MTDATHIRLSTRLVRWRRRAAGPPLCVLCAVQLNTVYGYILYMVHECLTPEEYPPRGRDSLGVSARPEGQGAIGASGPSMAAKAVPSLPWLCGPEGVR